MKTAIVTDSTSYLDEDILSHPDLYILPLAVIIDGKAYREGIDITNDEYYDKLKQTKELPKTSQPSIGEVEELFQKLAKEYDAIVSIHISSKISGTFANVAGVAERMTEIPIYAIDSLSTSVILEICIKQALSMIEEGYDAAKIAEVLERMVQSAESFFFVDDLEILVRGGRLSRASAFLGKALSIKPLLYFKDGSIQVYEKCRTKKRALQRMVSVFEEAYKRGTPFVTGSIHVRSLEEGIAFRDDLRERFPGCDFKLSTFGPVIGTHTGEGVLGMGWIVDPKSYL